MSLQVSAENILQKLNLPEMFNDIGEVHLIGNVALKTTVKPDIDIQIYSDQKMWESNSELIIRRMADLGITEHIKRELKESRKYLTSFNYYDEKTCTQWSIDITQTVPSNDYLKDGFTFYKKYVGKMSSENNEIILRLKKYFLEKDMLHHSMSYYIYRAVLDNNAKTVKDVYCYLESNKVYLGKFKK